MGLTIRRKFLLLASLLGALLWLLDGVLDYFFFYQGSFLGLVFTRVPPHELYIRLFWFAGVIVIGVFASRIIHDRENALEDKEELESLLRSVRNVNQLLVRNDDINSLIEETCNDLIKTRGFHHVWIALLDENNNFITAAEAGLGQDFNQIKSRLKSGLLPERIERVLNDSGILTAEESLVSCEDCPLVEECGAGTTVTVRLEYGDRVFGLISASMPEGFVTNQGELGLFNEVAGDIAFGLNSIGVEEKKG